MPGDESTERDSIAHVIDTEILQDLGENMYAILATMKQGGVPMEQAIDATLAMIGLAYDCEVRRGTVRTTTDTVH